MNFQVKHSNKMICSVIDLTGTWNAAICDAMAPKEGDVVVKGKKGLDAFPNTDLEEILVKKGIETVALGGFLTNCCVESTMRLVEISILRTKKEWSNRICVTDFRTAYEKGFNVITLKDCTGATSMEAQKAAADGTYGMFSSPMTKDEFIAKLTSK